MNLKLLLIPLTGFACSSLFAGTMGGVCADPAVTIPCVDNYRWEVGASALWLRPSSGIFNLETTSSTTSEETDVFNSTSDVKRGHMLEYSPAFMVEGSYYFPEGNDININWTHLNGKDTIRATHTFRTFHVDTPADNTNYVYYFKDNDTTEFDAVNVEFAKTSHWGSQTDFRLYGGGQYARLEGTINEYKAAGGTENSTTITKFSGVGPRVGIDGHYKLNYGFSLMAQAAIGVLAGEESRSISATGVSTGNPTINTSASYVRHYHFAPELDMKLGLNKAWLIRENEFNLTAGWAFQQYYSAFPYSTSNDQSFSLQGPYIQGRYLF